MSSDTTFSHEVLDENNDRTYFKKSVKELVELIKREEKEKNLVDEYSEKSKEESFTNYTWEEIENQYDTFFNDIMGANA